MKPGGTAPSLGTSGQSAHQPLQTRSWAFILHVHKEFPLYINPAHVFLHTGEEFHSSLPTCIKSNLPGRPQEVINQNMFKCYEESAKSSRFLGFPVGQILQLFAAFIWSSKYSAVVQFFVFIQTLFFIANAFF